MKSRRTTLALIAALAVLTLTGCGDDNSAPPAAEPSATVTALSCPNELRNTGSIGYLIESGYDTVEQAADEQLREDESVAVLELGARKADAFVLRPDGSARMVLHLERGSIGWYWELFESCDGEGMYYEGPTAAGTNLECGDEPVLRATVVNLEEGLGGNSTVGAVGHWVDPRTQTTGAEAITEDEALVSVIDEDGVAHVQLGVVRRDESWRIETLTACADDAPGFAPSVEPREAMTIAVGHCWVDTVEYAGRQWDLRDADQIGWGGQMPDSFRGVGTATVRGDSLTYVDASGKRLDFVPDDTPGTDANAGICG